MSRMVRIFKKSDKECLGCLKIEKKEIEINYLFLIPATFSTLKCKGNICRTVRRTCTMKQLRTSELADIEKQDSEKSTFLVQYSLNGTQS